MLVSGATMCLVLLLVCENIYARDTISKIFHKIKRTVMCCSLKPTPNNCIDEGDDDVKLEKVVVERYVTQQEEPSQNRLSVVVSKLYKNFFEFSAVRDLSFGVLKGECFGLLGMNGAGKTTTFNMMTLNETITNGSIEINNTSCRKNKFLYKSQFGYCPQADALNPQLSAYEILKYVAWVRGVPRQNLPEEVEYWLRRVDIEQYRDRPVELCSGGTKRKLNTAVAMVSERIMLVENFKIELIQFNLFSNRLAFHQLYFWMNLLPAWIQFLDVLSGSVSKSSKIKTKPLC
jgi:ABC-type glutathione transport system ATPase component